MDTHSLRRVGEAVGERYFGVSGRFTCPKPDRQEALEDGQTDIRPGRSRLPRAEHPAASGHGSEPNFTAASLAKAVKVFHKTVSKGNFSTENSLHTLFRMIFVLIKNL